jgi:hypothetical protein
MVDISGIPPAAVDIFIKMTRAKYTFNSKNDDLHRAEQQLLDVYRPRDSHNVVLTNNIREELAVARAYNNYCSAALDTWREGNDYIIYQSKYISILFNMAKAAGTALAAALNKEFWLETLIQNDTDLKTALRTAVEEADVAEIEARRCLCLAIDETSTNKPLIEIYDIICSNHLSLAKVIAELSISPLCVELLNDNSDYNSMFTSVFPNIVYINSLYNALKAANGTNGTNGANINDMIEFENAKNNVIIELTNMYMYELNMNIHAPPKKSHITA